MLRSIPFLLLLLHAPFMALAGVDVVVETKTFHLQGSAPRVEVNMAMLGGTFERAPNAHSFLQARLEVTTLVEQGGGIVTYAKTELLGPESMDSIQGDLLHQEFFNLAPGGYDLVVEVVDLNAADKTPSIHRLPLAVGMRPEGVSVSNILLAERITPGATGPSAKYGYHAVPLLSDYYPRELTEMNFYAEVYGTDAYFGTDSLYLLNYQIEGFEKRTVFGGFKRVARNKGKAVEPIIASFDIRDLPSGNYLLALEVRDKQGELVTRTEQFFMRNNPIERSYDLQAMNGLDLSNTFAGALNDVDSLVEHINSMRPIADQLERKIIDDRIKDKDPDLMRRFFYSFWSNKSVDPEQAWKDYHEQVIKVNKLFSCRVMKGYETDRGMVYLKYGAPNTMMDRLNEMGTYPYTIWHYYRAGRYTNRRFVFYQPDLANTCMVLLHSEVPGEISNPQWNNILHQRNIALPGVQTQQPGSLESERVNEFFNDPR
ncbi:MAG: GWxTD domain-containing protein [Flavobacteriales bacterium]|jgi:GWxTD domain-containing protein|nr:GWxTD domain-containing protein [Flavobacteriales bacterium]